MESSNSKSLFSSVLPSLPLQKQKFGQIIKRSSGIAYSSRNRKRSESYDERNKYNYKRGELVVDESMIVLRKRIHEMKMIERNYEPPADWMEWEKQCYTSYDDFICKFVGFLQSHLMNTRPCLALGILFLVSISVPISTLTISFHLFDAANGLLSAVHLW